MGGKKKRVLITGGGGFLGSAIAGRLADRGDSVTSFSRSDHPALRALGIRQIRGDIRDADAVTAACHGMDLVFHVAAKTGIWGAYTDYYAVNVRGTQNVLAACNRASVPFLVHTSSPSVIFDGTHMEGVNESVPYPPHFSAHYPKTKALAEQAVLEAVKDGLKALILRPHLIWGPGDTALVPRIIARARSLVRVGDGRNRVDTIFIDNAADAHVRAADRLEADPGLSGNIYFISQDRPIPLWEMVDRILEAAGLPPVKGSMPAGVAWVMGSLLEGVYTLFRIRTEPRMTRFLAEELSTSHWFDIRAAREDLGYEPWVSTEEGLRRLQDWLRSGSVRTQSSLG